MKQIIYSATISGTVEENLRNIGYSSKLITKLRKELGLIVSIDKNVPLRTIDKLVVGEKFSITLKDEIKREIPDYNIQLNFVYEDDDIAVINKPYNLAVISTSNYYAKSLENALHSIWGDFIYRPVNRLDKDTSGLMIVAKNQLAHSVLNKQNIIKKYVALVSGKLSGKGTIEAPIYKRETGSMVRVIDARGQYAKTYYKSLKVYEEYSLVEFTLYTGRTHQIRVHAKHIGHPLCCDFLYNDNPAPIITPNGNTLSRTALHSSYLEFDHPITKQKIILTSKADFE